MKKIFFVIAVVAGITACQKNQAKIIPSPNGGPCSTTDTTTPACMMNIIAGILQEEPYNPRAAVYEYDYNSQRVFYVTSGCCDFYNLLYDANCNVICAPDGGIAGKGDGQCADFFTVATGRREVWRDPR